MLPRRSFQIKTVPRRRVVVFALAGRRFALPAERVVEVARVSTYTPLPCENPAHLGVVSHRDSVIPLLDLARELGARRADSLQSPGLCLFCMTELGEIACPVDQVVGLAPAPDEGFAQSSTLSAGIPIFLADGWEEPGGQAAAG